MRSTIFIAAISCLISAGTVMAAPPVNSFQNQGVLKGYVTMGRIVVVLPERLQVGDHIEIIDAQGTSVLEQFVGNGYLSANVSWIPAGVYSLVVSRGREVLAIKKVPIAGQTRL